MVSVVPRRRAEKPSALPSDPSAAGDIPADEAVDAAVEGEDVELAVGVLAERRDVELLLALEIDQLGIGDGLAVPLAEAPDPPGVVIGVDIDADQLGQGLAAVDVAAGDALAVVGAFAGRVVGVFD